MRYRIPAWARPDSDEGLALLLTATLCAGGPAALLGARVPGPTFLSASALAAIALAVVLGVSIRRGRGVARSLAHAAGAALLLAAAAAVVARLVARRADAWFAPEPLYEAAALMLGGHLAGLAIARLGPRLPVHFHRLHARPLDLGASAERLARAMVRGAIGWLALCWALVALDLPYVSAVVLLLAAGSVGVALPLCMLVGAMGVAVPAATPRRYPDREGHRHAAHV